MQLKVSLSAPALHANTLLQEMAKELGNFSWLSGHSKLKSWEIFLAF